MALRHVYLALERLNLNDTQWAAIKAFAAAQVANASHANPSHRYATRLRLDGLVIIGEAEFEGDQIGVQQFIDAMAAEFGILAALIGDSTGYNSYGRFSTFSYPDGVTNRYRMGLFGATDGGGWPSWGESKAAVVQYLIDNNVAWGDVEEA